MIIQQNKTKKKNDCTHRCETLYNVHLENSKVHLRLTLHVLRLETLSHGGKKNLPNLLTKSYLSSRYVICMASKKKI